MSYVEIFGQNLADPMIALFNSFVYIFPKIILAVIILVIGYLIAYVLGHALRVLLEKAGLDRQLAKGSVSKTIGNVHMSSVFGELVKWFIFLGFIASAAKALELDVLSALLMRFVEWIPNLIWAVVIMVAGLWLALFVEHKIDINTRMRGSRFIGGVFKYVILFIAILIGLGQIGINVRILETAFLILIGGISLGVGLAFGLGCKKEAQDWLRQIRKNF